MKNILLTSFGILLSFVLQGQSKKDGYFNVGVDGGLMLMQNSPYTNMNFFAYRIPAAGQAYAQYNFNDALGLRGSIFGAISSGSNTPAQYHEGTYGMGDLRLTVNFLGFNNSEIRSRLELDLGVGGMIFNSYLMNRTSTPKPEVVARIPHNRGSVGLATTLTSALRFSTPVYNDLYLNLGLQLTHTPGNQWLDAYDGGESGDLFLMPLAGLSYSLKRAPKPNEINVDKRKYENLNNEMASLRQKVDEEESKAQMKEEESRATLAAIQRELKDALDARDSAMTELERSKARPGSGVSDTRTRTTPTGDEMWRVIVGSYPSKALAERFVRRTGLDKSEMEIVYEQNLNTYRVIYKSSPNLDQARKYRDAAKHEIPDVWIIKM
jgi:hypothetical protein